MTKILARYLRYISKINQHIAPCGFAIRMDATGKKKNEESPENIRVCLYHPDTFNATASVIAHGVNLLLKNKLKKTGLFTFGEIIDPLLLLNQLRSKNFLVEGI